MELTNKQEQALKIAVQRYYDGEPYTCIAGYAGTGKSTLVHYIIAALGLDPDSVKYVAYTGKAAQVLRNKGNSNAVTAHRLLYQSFPRGDGTFMHIPRETIEGNPPLIVVDEISMLPAPMWQLLLRHCIPVLALGDPGQLPPVAAEDNGVLKHPHIFLDQVMRQAQDSEIIRLTMDIREGRGINFQQGHEVRIVGPEELNHPGFLLWADQIICAKNATRHYLNAVMRKKLLGIDEDQFEPVVGDKLICLRNDWERINDTGDALVNGLTGTLESIVWTKANPYLKKTPYIDFQPDIPESTKFSHVMADYNIFENHTATVQEYYQKRKKIPKPYHPEEFDYGYVITCHKSQGSEFDKVIVLEEFLKSESREDHIKWLYTAATRASRKLIMVKDYH